jgi:hypothetical protein
VEMGKEAVMGGASLVLVLRKEGEALLVLVL